MIRRILADLLDPGRVKEMFELRETASKAKRVERQATEHLAAIEILRLRERTQHAAELAITQAMQEAAELEARTALADVARLLEAAARCAHEHSEP